MKIVRKVDRRSGDTLAAWIGASDRICGWWEFDGGTTADEEIARYGDTAGWPIDPKEANRVGTTLAALRDELTEEAPPEHWVEASQEVPPPSPAPMEAR